MEAIGQQKPSLRLFCLNDVYAFEATGGHGGFASSSTMLKVLREQAEQNGIPHITTVNGDFIGGSSLAERTKGKVVVDIINHMKVDVVVAGNHEFDHGGEELKGRIEESKCMWLGANIKEKSTGSIMKGIQRTNIMEIGGLRIGWFGVCTEATPKMSYPGDNVVFEPSIEVAKECVAELQEQNVDLIIAVTHLHLAKDKELLRLAPGIDILLGGHDHDPFSLLDNGSLLFKCGQNAYWVGVVDIYPASTVEGSSKRPFYYSWSMLTTKGVLSDPRCLEIQQDHKKKVEMAEQEELGGVDLHEVLTVLQDKLSTKSNILRTQEGAAGDLIADAMFDYYAHFGGKPDYAFINGGFIRGDTEYPAGTAFTRRMVRDELPFPRKSTCLEIAGKNIRKAHEQQLRFHPAASGSFPHFSRQVEAQFDPDRTVMDRIVSLKIKGVEIDPEKRYRIVCTEFCADGGDGCSEFCYGVHQGEVEGTRISEILSWYMEKHPEIAPKLAGRLKRVTT